MRSLAAWAELSFIVSAVLQSPVLAFLMALAVEILIGLLKDGGVPALLALASLVLSAGSCLGSSGCARKIAPQTGRERSHDEPSLKLR